MANWCQVGLAARDSWLLVAMHVFHATSRRYCSTWSLTSGSNATLGVTSLRYSSMNPLTSDNNASALCVTLLFINDDALDDVLMTNKSMNSDWSYIPPPEIRGSNPRMHSPAVAEVRMRTIITLVVEWELRVYNLKYSLVMYSLRICNANCLTVMPLFSDITDVSIIGHSFGSIIAAPPYCTSRNTETAL